MNKKYEMEHAVHEETHFWADIKKKYDFTKYEQYMLKAFCEFWKLQGYKIKEKCVYTNLSIKEPYWVTKIEAVIYKGE